MTDDENFISTEKFNLLLLNVLKEKEDYTDKCLITNSELKKPFITLKCNHTFNYEAIYKEVNLF